MPPKAKENDSLIAGLDGIKSIQESIAGETEKMNAIIERMKKDVTALEVTQAEHTGIIEDNTGRIKALESVKNHHDDRLIHVEERIEKLERKQDFYQRVEDQDRRIFQILKFIPPAELTKSSCLILLHGIPLDKNINELDPRVPAEITLIKDSLSKGLSKRITDFIFEVTRDGNFKNISGWSKGPEICNFRYGEKTPENARNSLMFFCSNRVQALSLEAELRRALIESFPKRRETEYSALELGIHSENAKIRALHKFLLFKGKMLVENLDNAFDQYRVAFRGGSRRGGQTTVNLALELRASKRVIETERKSYFMSEDGASLIKNPWTDSKNVRVSEPLSSWFPPKNEFVERAERRIVKTTNTERTERTKNKDIKCDHPDCNETFRSIQGLNSHKTKAHNKGVHVVSNSEDEEEEEEEADGEESDADEISTMTKSTTEAQLHQADEGVDETGFTPVNKKKKEKAKKLPAAAKPNTRHSTKASPSFASVTSAAGPTPNSKQTKITTFGKTTTSINSNLFPVPT